MGNTPLLGGSVNPCKLNNLLREASDELRCTLYREGGLYARQATVGVPSVCFGSSLLAELYSIPHPGEEMILRKTARSAHGLPFRAAICVSLFRWEYSRGQWRRPKSYDGRMTVARSLQQQLKFRGRSITAGIHCTMLVVPQSITAVCQNHLQQMCQASIVAPPQAHRIFGISKAQSTLNASSSRGAPSTLVGFIVGSCNGWVALYTSWKCTPPLVFCVSRWGTCRYVYNAEHRKRRQCFDDIG